LGIAITDIVHDPAVTQKVKTLYEKFGARLKAYTCKNYEISEDDAWNIVYKTIYKIAGLSDSYVFENEQKKSAFIFKTHINYLRNHFRDNKSFEARNREVHFHENISTEKEELAGESLQLKVLQLELDKLEEWERILLLMRGQGMPYSAIAKFVDKPEKQLKVYYGRLKKRLLVSVNEELINIKKLKNGKK
jgi:DNA-directed RNA polymerase specialized sigma24 family protein